MARFVMLALALSCINSIAFGQATEPPVAQAGNAQVAEIMKTFEPRGVQSDGSQPTPPMESLKTFKMRDGFHIDLVASEPEISQPLFISWDSRGRMWVVQYRQYQYPSGLKVVRFDQHLRAVFDKVPEAPPNHVPGKDRITVFEDQDGDGKFDSHRDVITGLNIATSVAIGRGGIWVLNPPYLLFYPDANGDDVPDRDPEVHLSGFGLQDTHSVANSLMWGPDGWLYGANGSTTGGTISSEATAGITFQGQCIWRYHPGTKIFEIYAEGGGNTFSLDIDAKGRVFSGTNGGDTRGWHYPQGSYARKNWGKHGPLTNPYAFGFFEAMKFRGDGRRFPQAFLIYEGGLFPKQEFDGSIIAPNAMQNLIWHSQRVPDGSTYQTIDEANLAESSDRWFRPVYSGVGPDGAVYIADWYDTRLSHVSPTDDWHKESGRIFRIAPNHIPPIAVGDLEQFTSAALIDLFSHPNKWVRQRAVLELSWRGKGASEADLTTRLVAAVDDLNSLEAIWVLSAWNELSSERATQWLSHRDADIRRWVVRLLGDRHEDHPVLIAMARTESDVQVRSQLAATAKRLSARTGLQIVRQLLTWDVDQSDPHMPLMDWWAIESHAAHFSAIEEFLSDPQLWELPLVRAEILGRLMQRYASTGTAEDLLRCEQIMALAPDSEARELLVVGLNKAFQGRTLPPLPDKLHDALQAYQRARGAAGVVLGIRQGNEDAFAEGLKTLKDASADLGLRIELARAFGEVKYSAALDYLLQLATGRMTREPSLQRIALSSLAIYDDPRIAMELTRGFDSNISAEHSLRDTGCRTLASRQLWALALLKEVNEWRLKPADIPADVVQRLRTYQHPEVMAAVEKAFGKPADITSPEKLAEIRRLGQLLGQGRAAAVGNPDLGAVHFQKRCASCHRLFGQGQSIGPPLDNYDRANTQFWLPAIVAPSIEIREGFQSYVALTVDGRVVTGMIDAQDPRTVTLRTADNRFELLAREELEELRALPTSLMPEDLLVSMSDSEIQDLFAYLMSNLPNQ